jgi:hypothetical protein
VVLPTIYKIHPSIGVARVGNSPDAFFIGPEVPGRPPEGDDSCGSTVPPFKDSSGKIKRQGARFRVYRYDDNGKGQYAPVDEKTLDSKDVEWIVWSVHLANKKSGFFQFDGLLGDVVYGPTGVTPRRRNASVVNPKDLWLDPGVRRISGRSAGPVEFSKKTSAIGPSFWPRQPLFPPIEYTGELRTDPSGRLVVLGGRGAVASLAGAADIRYYANNDGWFDDIADGPVDAFIKLKGVPQAVQAAGAWVLCAPPCFAPYSQHIVTLWDTLFDLNAREVKLPANDARFDGALKSLKAINREFFGRAWGENTLSKYIPVFEDDIWPILKRGLQIVFLYRPAKSAHVLLGNAFPRDAGAALYPLLASNDASTQELRKVLFKRLHPPGVNGDGMPNQDMPRLLGDDPDDRWKVADRRRLTLTPTQHALMDQWAKGHFTATAIAPPGLPPATIAPDGLDKAALENCVGGAFYPGIECSWQIRHPDIFKEPFRIHAGAPSQYLADANSIDAGHFSRQMAVPWQADFLYCHQAAYKRDDNGAMDLWGWWPVQRPHHVYVSEDEAKASNLMISWVRSTKDGARVDWASGGQEEPSFTEMLANWMNFGFVLAKGDLQFETERPPNVPDTP